MNSTYVKLTLIALGLAMGCIGAFSSVSAKESILQDVIDDYSDETYGSFAEQSSSPHMGGYRIEMVLDEAYHDYSGTEATAAYNASLEKAEFAVFETVGRPLTSPSGIPWDLMPLD
jgi:hypothetical protein